jgi:hypothetical protein
MRKYKSYALPVAVLTAGASLLTAGPAMADEAPTPAPSLDVPVAPAPSAQLATEVDAALPGEAGESAPIDGPGASDVPSTEQIPDLAPVPEPTQQEAPTAEVPSVEVPLAQAAAAEPAVQEAVAQVVVASETSAEAKAAYDLAVREAVAAKWRAEVTARDAAIRAAVAAKWRYEAAVRAAVAAKWRADAAYIAAIQANMRARAAAANPYAASEAWASSWQAQSVIRCESGGNYSINTGNGYYGAWQFDYRTWLGNGGGQFAPYAHMATPAQQNYIAYRTWQARGWQPWACA